MNANEDVVNSKVVTGRPLETLWIIPAKNHKVWRTVIKLYRQVLVEVLLEVGGNWNQPRQRINRIPFRYFHAFQVWKFDKIVSYQVMQLLSVDRKASRKIRACQMDSPGIDKECINVFPVFRFLGRWLGPKLLVSGNHCEWKSWSRYRRLNSWGYCASLTLTLCLAFDHWPKAIPKRKSGPRRAIQNRFNLSRNGWYHLSSGEPTLGKTETQQQSSIVKPQDQIMSPEPLLSGVATQPFSRTSVVLLLPIGKGFACPVGSS